MVMYMGQVVTTTTSPHISPVGIRPQYMYMNQLNYLTLLPIPACTRHKEA